MRPVHNRCCYGNCSYRYQHYPGENKGHSVFLRFNMIEEVYTSMINNGLYTAKEQNLVNFINWKTLFFQFPSQPGYYDRNVCQQDTRD